MPVAAIAAQMIAATSADERRRVKDEFLTAALGGIEQPHRRAVEARGHHVANRPRRDRRGEGQIVAPAGWSNRRKRVAGQLIGDKQER